MARLILACLLAAAAAGAPRAVAPRPAPALQELAPLLGEWRCSGTQQLSPSAKPSPTAGTWTFARDLDGFWIAVAQEQRQTAANPHPLKARGSLGYNADQQRFVLGLATNDGLSEQEGSPGWDGRLLVFNGQLRDGEDVVNFRRTFEAAGDRLQVTLELSLVEKQWTQVASETCAR